MNYSDIMCNMFSTKNPIEGDNIDSQDEPKIEPDPGSRRTSGYKRWVSPCYLDNLIYEQILQVGGKIIII